MEPQLAETAFVDLREAQTDQTAFLCHRPFPQPDPAVFAPQGRRVCLVGLAQGPDLGGQLRLVSLSALQGGDAPLRRREGGLVSLLLHRVGQAVHCRSVGLLARLLPARRVLDWDAQWECALDPETAKAIRADRAPEHEDTCSMCGKFCAVRSMNKALNGEHIDIL